jgi:hypothetical protein
MKSKSLLILFFLTAALFTYVYYGIEKPAKEKESGANKENALALGKLDALQTIQIKTANQTIDFERQSIGWRMTAPEKDLASQSKIENLITALEKLRKTRVIADPEKLKTGKVDLAQYGLQPAKAIIRYKTSDLPNPVVIELGQANPSNTSSYVKTEKEGVVLATMDLDFVTLGKADDYREMRFTTVGASDFEEMEFTWNGKTTKFKHDKEDWVMTQPYQLPLDQDFTKSFMEKISFVRANTFTNTPMKGFEKPDIRIVVGFKKDVKDLRSNETDPRPQGYELRLTKVRNTQAKKSKEKGDEFEYFAKGDKTAVGNVAKFHYDNFTKQPEDFIKKTFDVFLDAEVEKMTISKPQHADIVITKVAQDFQLTSGKDSTAADTTKVNKLLNQLRNLRASKFLEISKSQKSQPLLTIQIDRKEKKPIRFLFDLQKDATILWASQDDKILKYALPKDAIAPKDLEWNNLKASATKEVSNAIEESTKKPREANAENKPGKHP